MHPVLFRVGGYTGYAYTAALVVGLLAGTWVAYHRAWRRGIDPVAVLDGAFWAILCGVLGARAGYVLVHWTYFADHVLEALDLREGGLSWHGALVGACLGVVAWAAVRRRQGRPPPETQRLCDAAAPGVSLCAAWAWLGCLLAGAGYGLAAQRTTPVLGWFVAELPDIYGVREVRYLTQPAMLAWSLLLWALLQVRLSPLRRLPPGSAVLVALALYAGADLGIWFLRGDGAWRFGLWLAQWADLVVIGAAAGIGVWTWLRSARSPARQETTGDKRL
ncbi:MAG: prolipoprotein diacylglyceryl transferase [Anaerolineae bacterium]|nr:prolipoprotein diacylglyceryl transferase [Anaerolineae bacterium]